MPRAPTRCRGAHSLACVRCGVRGAISGALRARVHAERADGAKNWGERAPYSRLFFPLFTHPKITRRASDCRQHERGVGGGVRGERDGAHAGGGWERVWDGACQRAAVEKKDRRKRDMGEAVEPCARSDTLSGARPAAFPPPRRPRSRACRSGQEPLPPQPRFHAPARPRRWPRPRPCSPPRPPPRPAPGPPPPAPRRPDLHHRLLRAGGLRG